MNPIEIKSAEQFHQTLKNQSTYNSKVSLRDTLKFISDNIQYLNQSDAIALQKLRAKANRIDPLEDKLTIIERIDELAQAITHHTTLENIPREIALQIIALLNKEDWNQLRQVNKQWNTLANDPNILVIYLKKYINKLSPKQAINLACRCGVQLKELDLSGMKKEIITNEHLKRLAKNCPELKILRLPYARLFNTLTQITDEGFTAITQLKKLQMLVVNVENIHTESLQSIANLKELQSLEISSTWSFDDEAIKLIVQLKNLKSLNIENIAGRLMTDKGLFLIAHDLAKLEYLSLPESPNFSDDGMLALANHCHQLKALSLNGGNFTDEAFKCIAEHFPHLKSLTLMNNRLVTSQAANFLLESHKDLQKLHFYNVGFSSQDIIGSDVSAFQNKYPNLNVIDTRK